VGPAFHDAQAHAGPTYHYTVSAVSQSGYESARSTEATETVPNR
jgi:fibronectin type 3 domain-containing protein